MITKPYFKSLFYELRITLKLALPIVLSQLGQLSFGLMDTAMVGRAGVVPLSASAFVNNVCNIPMVFALGMSSAVSVLIAQSFGEKNYKNCGRILNNALLFIGLITFLIIIGLILLSGHLSIFQQPIEVLNESYNYYLTISWSILPFILFFVLKHFSEGISHPVVPLAFLGIGLLANFILNSLLIYGLYGFPELGLYGAGIATLISRVLVVVLFYIYILRSKIYEKFRTTFASEKIDIYAFKDLARIGIPSGFQYLFEVAAFAGSGIMIGWLGTKALAAHQIALQIASTTFMMALGLSFAVGVRVGQLKGEQNYPALRQVGIGSFSFVGITLGILGVGILLTRNYLPTLFISDVEVEQMAAQILIIVCLFQISDSTQAVAMSALRGLQDVKIPTVIAFFAYWVVALPLGYYLAFKEGYKHMGIWAALGISLLISSMLLVARFLHKSKKLVKENEITYGT
ncbi:MAG: MATE family efflux transporter [Bdellovibrionota bacterium]